MVSVGRDEFALKVDRFELLTLLEEARGNMPKSRSGDVSLIVAVEQQRRGKAAQRRSSVTGHTVGATLHR